MNDTQVLDFLAHKARTAKYITSVCTGSLVLGAAGLLRGYKATSHWAARDLLAGLGAHPEQKTLHDRENLPFPLLSDPDGKVASLYEVRDQTHHIKNCTFVVDPTGLVVLVMKEKDIRPSEHGQQLLDEARCCFVPMPTSEPGKIGATVADFSLPRADTGTAETLYGDHTAKATVVFFISAKCPCSQGYDARMKALADRYMPMHVRFVGINSSADETASDAAAHRKRVGYPYPVLRDDGNVIADRMNARVTPEAFLLDAQGVLRYHGRIDDDRTGQHIKSHELANALDAVLMGKQPVVAYQAGLGCAIFRKQNQTITIN